MFSLPSVLSLRSQILPTRAGRSMPRDPSIGSRDDAFHIPPPARRPLEETRYYSGSFRSALADYPYGKRCRGSLEALRSGETSLHGSTLTPSRVLIPGWEPPWICNLRTQLVPGNSDHL